MERSLLLIRAGLTNHDTEDISDVGATSAQHRRGTFCSSKQCRKRGESRTGSLVHVGERFLTKCPNCESTMLFYSLVSATRARVFEELKNRQLEKQGEQCAN